MPIYNKLIRDKIPQVMDQENKTYEVRVLGDDEYVIELKKKLGEELGEYLAADNDKDAIEELADLQELVYALLAIHGSNPEELEEVRRRKEEKRGGFKDKLFLIEVHE